jgi:class 3 adenylate cyclase
VGRELELDELTTSLNLTLSGVPQFVLLSGEAGVGKTRLLRELSAIARRLEVRVVHGRAMEDATTPCLPFLGIIEACATPELWAWLSPQGEQAPLAALAATRAMQDFAREIARELLMAPQQVAALAETLFHRIGVDGPGLATAYAFAGGLVGTAGVRVPAPTVLMVTDMVDFTGLLQRLGDVRGRVIVHRHNRVIRHALSETQGHEVAHTGDGIIASFQSPDAALRCASSIQRQLLDARTERPESAIHVRIGLNAGSVLQEEERLFGAALVAAVRICSCAQAGQILLSDSTLALLDEHASARALPLGSFDLKGFSAPAQLYAWPV